MAKKKTSKRTTRARRAEILATAKAKGWTADQVAKKFGVSKWTYYGWRKAKSGSARTTTWGRKTRRLARGSSVPSGIMTSALREEIRTVLPGILREELASALSGLLGMGAKRRGRRRGKK